MFAEKSRSALSIAATVAAMPLVFSECQPTQSSEGLAALSQTHEMDLAAPLLLAVGDGGLVNVPFRGEYSLLFFTDLPARTKLQDVLDDSKIDRGDIIRNSPLRSVLTDRLSLALDAYPEHRLPITLTLKTDQELTARDQKIIAQEINTLIQSLIIHDPLSLQPRFAIAFDTGGEASQKLGLDRHVATALVVNPSGKVDSPSALPAQVAAAKSLNNGNLFVKSMLTEESDRNPVVRNAAEVVNWETAAQQLWQEEVSGPQSQRAADTLQALLESCDFGRARSAAKALVSLAQEPLSDRERVLIEAAHSVLELPFRGGVRGDLIGGLALSLDVANISTDVSLMVSATPIVKPSAGSSKEYRAGNSTIWLEPGNQTSLLREDLALLQQFSFGPIEIDVQLEFVGTVADGSQITTTRILPLYGFISGRDTAWFHLPNVPQKELDVRWLERTIEKAEMEMHAAVKPVALTSHPLIGRRFPFTFMAHDADSEFAVPANSFEHTVIKVSFNGCPPCRLAEGPLDAFLGEKSTAVTLIVQTLESDLAHVEAGHQEELTGLAKTGIVVKHAWGVADHGRSDKLLVEAFPTYFLVGPNQVIEGVWQGGTLRPADIQDLTDSR